MSTSAMEADGVLNTKVGHEEHLYRDRIRVLVPCRIVDIRPFRWSQRTQAKRHVSSNCQR